MSATSGIDLYLNTVIKEGMYSTQAKLRFEMDNLFRGVDLNGKRVLDIGGGSGIYSFYAASRGARKVLCIEPEAEGSSSGVTKEFLRLKEALGYDNVELKPLTFQGLDGNVEPFDVILLHNSVNHLNEPACITLLEDTQSQAIYEELFAKLHAMITPGGKLVVSDCSRYNFFALLKLRNPFQPSVEWQKHQAPEAWAKLLTKVGFAQPIIRWLSFNTFGNPGRILIGNKLASYFLASQFCLTMDRP